MRQANFQQLQKLENKQLEKAMMQPNQQSKTEMILFGRFESSQLYFYCILFQIFTRYYIDLMRSLMKGIAFLFIFSLCLANYDQKLASELSHYAAISYRIENVKSWNCPLCIGSPLVDRVEFSQPKYSLYGYAGYSPLIKAVVIAFRGTVMSWHNIITDLDYYDIDYNKASQAKVHRSFYRAFERLKDSFISKVNDLCKKHLNANIYVTGHSLGAALAVHAAAQLTNYQQVTAVYTFGEPRVGNKQFAQYIDSILDVYRVINRNDPIPSVPPRTSPLMSVTNKAKEFGKKAVSGVKKAGSAIKQGGSSLWKKTKNFFHFQQLSVHESFVQFSYSHQGQEIWYVPEDKTVYQCDSEDKQCYDSVPAYKISVKDHKMGNYMTLLQNAIKQNWKIQ